MNQSKKASNRLERFVRDHRDEFENLEPSLDLWEKLEAKLPNDTTLVQPVEKNTIIPFFLKFSVIGALLLVWCNYRSIRVMVCQSTFEQFGHNREPSWRSVQKANGTLR
jgi:hypothetical protein